jgi:drug/metabolite transporter (DMT)-like permease
LVAAKLSSSGITVVKQECASALQTHWPETCARGETAAYDALVNMLIGITCGGLRSSHWTRGAWLATLYLAIFGSLAGYTSYMFLLRNVRLSTVAIYAYVNPIVAVLLGWRSCTKRSTVPNG